MSTRNKDNVSGALETKSHHHLQRVAFSSQSLRVAGVPALQLHPRQQEGRKGCKVALSFYGLSGFHHYNEIPKAA